MAREVADLVRTMSITKVLLGKLCAAAQTIKPSIRRSGTMSALTRERWAGGRGCRPDRMA
jgi:hypothetical protein